MSSCPALARSRRAANADMSSRGACMAARSMPAGGEEYQERMLGSTKRVQRKGMGLPGALHWRLGSRAGPGCGSAPGRLCPKWPPPPDAWQMSGDAWRMKVLGCSCGPGVVRNTGLSARYNRGCTHLLAVNHELLGHEGGLHGRLAVLPEGVVDEARQQRGLPDVPCASTVFGLSVSLQAEGCNSSEGSSHPRQAGPA